MRYLNRFSALLTILLVSVACVDKDSTITATIDPVDADEDGFEADVDCDDDDPEIYPGAAEVCDGLDNNCNDTIDEGLTVSAWPDADGDGHGSSDGEETSCPGTEGWAENFGDCDDTDENVHPDASEVCDDVDNDCNGLIDEGLIGLLYPDVDGDGYGDSNYGEEICLDRSGWVAEGGDCDDDDDDVNPDAVEECDGLDNDCDELVDLDDPSYEGDLSCSGDTPTGPVSDYEGVETFSYSGGGSSGHRNCEMLWEAVGESIEAPASCVDCEFIFEIDMTYDSALSTDDGTCDSLAGDASYIYGYTEDYYGSGAYVMYYSWTYGDFMAWGPASLVGDTFSYAVGYEDYPYEGTYYTYLWAGEAELD